jgi:DNA-binding CsgD family transcriptional regulator/PAS domain-containing protein
MTSATLNTFLRLLPELYAAQPLDDLPRCLLAFLARLVPSDASGYNEVHLRPLRLVTTTDPPELSASEPIKRLEPLIRQHPVLQHQRRTGDLTARKISDFVSKAQFYRLPVYQEVYRPLGAEEQFALGLRVTGDIIVALALNRGRRNFTEEHRALLNLAQPHLAQAYRNAAALTRLRQQLAAAQQRVDALPMGVLVLDRRLRIVFATGRARKLLRDYFPHHASLQPLPDELRVWLLQKRQWQGRALPNATGSFCQESSAGILLVRCVRDGDRGETTLLLEERAPCASPAVLQQLGLTAREAEVLLWVARGKSNPEIGMILGVAARTVQKHLEHIFAKLGVGSRAEAGRRALEFFSPDLHLV